MGKSWDMIEAEVAALALPALRSEVWSWLDVHRYESADVETDLREADEAVKYADSVDDAEPFALERLRGWCTQHRFAHGGRTPDELS